jgi:hypothetical protein
MNHILENTYEQFETMQHIKGERYTQMAKFTMTLHQFSNMLLSGMTPERVEIAAELSRLACSSLLAEYSKALGFKKENAVEVGEAVRDGLRISDNTAERMFQA